MGRTSARQVGIAVAMLGVSGLAWGQEPGVRPARPETLLVPHIGGNGHAHRDEHGHRHHHGDGHAHRHRHAPAHGHADPPADNAHGHTHGDGHAAAADLRRSHRQWRL